MGADEPAWDQKCYRPGLWMIEGYNVERVTDGDGTAWVATIGGSWFTTRATLSEVRADIRARG